MPNDMVKVLGFPDLSVYTKDSHLKLYEFHLWHRSADGVFATIQPNLQSAVDHLTRVHGHMTEFSVWLDREALVAAQSNGAWYLLSDVALEAGVAVSFTKYQ